MNIVKYDNFWNDPFADADNWFDQAFGLAGLPSLRGRLLPGSLNESFRVDVYDDADNYYVVAELPGIHKEDIDIQLENAILNISGVRKLDKPGEKSSSTFSRSITVADDIDASKVSANLEDGLLRITLPKAEERKPKAIAVK